MELPQGALVTRMRGLAIVLAVFASLLVLVAFAAFGAGDTQPAIGMWAVGGILLGLAMWLWGWGNRHWIHIDGRGLQMQVGKRLTRIRMDQLAGLQITYHGMATMIAGGIAGGAIGAVLAQSMDDPQLARGSPVMISVWSHGALKPVNFKLTTTGKRSLTRWLDEIAPLGVPIQHGR